MKRLLLPMLILAFLFTGCESNISEQDTTAMITDSLKNTETVPVPSDDFSKIDATETMEQEIVYLSPYINENRMDRRTNPTFHCLIRNDSADTITLDSVSTVYLFGQDIVKQTAYKGNEMSSFFRRQNASYELRPMESNLLIIDEVPDETFDHVTVIATILDCLGETTELIFYFSMNPEETTKLDMSFRGSDISFTRDDGWSWVHEVINDTDTTLKLESVHYVEYLDGTPLYLGNDPASFYKGYHIEDIESLKPGESGIFANSISYQFLDFNQRETIFVYRDKEGNPHYKTFFFHLEQALTHTEYLGMPSGLKILLGETGMEVLGDRKLSDYEIKVMAESDLSLDEVAEKISTLADCMKFLSYKGFSYDEVPMKTKYHQGFAWNYLDDAEEIFARNYGACGCGSTLINYILTGDYEQQGYVMEVNAIDRHIYNWFFEDGVYYFVDWVSQELLYENTTGYNIYATKDPQVYSDYKVKMSRENSEGNEIYLQYLYERDGSVMPIGIQRTIMPYTRFVPSSTQDDITLLYENSKKCTLELMEGPSLF